MLGDHIRALKDGRWLHGIDLGDQRVLYLAEAPGLAPGDRLRRVYRPEFTANATKVELVVHREPAYPAKAVVARAWSRFMDPSVVAMFRDSESFAAWCKIGRLPESAPAAPPPAMPMAARAAAAPVKPAPAAAPRKPAKAAAPKAAAEKPSRPKAKAAAQKAPARKAPAKKAAAKRAPSKKAAPKKAPVKKAPSKKVAGKRAPAKKASAKRAPAKKPAQRKRSRR